MIIRLLPRRKWFKLERYIRNEITKYTLCRYEGLSYFDLKCRSINRKELTRLIGTAKGW